MKINERIKLLRESHGLSQEELANKVGYRDRSSIAKVEAGKVDLAQSKIQAFADAFNVTHAYLMGLEEDVPVNALPMPDMARVPRVGRIACGEPITAEENIEAYDETPQNWHADFTLLCVGDSMSPKIEDGDLVAIRKQSEVINGQIAAVRIGDEATLKQVFLHDDYIELRPINPAYASFIRRRDEMNEIRIEGKAVGLLRSIE